MSSTRYGFLLTQLVMRDIAGRYRGSTLGKLWVLLSPLIMLAVYTFVFSVVFKVRWNTGDTSSNTDFALNLFVGVLLHALLGETLARSPGIMRGNASYVKKMIFPLWLLPLSVVISALVFCLFGFGVFLLFFVVFNGLPPVAALLLPLLLLPLALFALGVGWFLAALGVYLRDIEQVTPFFVTVLMFMAPIFYPASAIPEGYRWLLQLNPLTYPVEAIRDLFFLGRVFEPVGYLLYSGCGMLVAAAGFVFFARLRKGFADVV